MLKGKMVRVRFTTEHIGKPTWVFIGKVIYFVADWVGIDGKGILVYRRETTPQQQRTWKGATMTIDPQSGEGIPPALIDEESRTIMFPRESIANIRTLPDDFDLDNIRFCINYGRLDLVVDGSPDSSIDTWLED